MDEFFREVSAIKVKAVSCTQLAAKQHPPLEHLPCVSIRCRVGFDASPTATCLLLAGGQGSSTTSPDSALSRSTVACIHDGQCCPWGKG